MVRLLFLGNSNDVNPSVPDEHRSPALTAALLGEAIGEPVEVTTRVIWPDRGLPGLVAGWLERYEPDIVLVKVNWYWYGYESVPARLERLLGRPGSAVGRLGLAAAEVPAVGHRRAFRSARRLARRVVGGDAFFTPTQVIETICACGSLVLAAEGPLLVVKGTATYAPEGEPSVRDYLPRFVDRRDRVEGAIAAWCRQRGVPWDDNRALGGLEHGGVDQGDGIHHDRLVHETMARLHAATLAAAWRARTV